MKPTGTPSALPSTGRAFVITLPDGEEWTAIFAGMLALGLKWWYWTETAGGLTVDETIEAWQEIIWQLGHDEGTPE